MVTSYIGADVDCRMTELAVERKGHIIARDRITLDFRGRLLQLETCHKQLTIFKLDYSRNCQAEQQ